MSEYCTPHYTLSCHVCPHCLAKEEKLTLLRKALEQAIIKTGQAETELAAMVHANEQLRRECDELASCLALTNETARGLIKKRDELEAQLNAILKTGRT